MKVLLTKDVSGLGKIGDVKDVSDGYARNFLLRQHLGLPATASVLAQVQKEEKEKQARIVKEQERFLALKNKLEGKSLVIKAKSEGKNLFAAIHEKEIAQKLIHQFGIEISPQLMRISNPIKSLGVHKVEIKFSENIKSTINVEVQNAD
jgi:large subunit ribosomal protein L9